MIENTYRAGTGILLETFAATLSYLVNGVAFADEYSTVEGAEHAVRVLPSAANGVVTAHAPVCVHGAERGECEHVERTYATRSRFVRGRSQGGGWLTEAQTVIVCIHHRNAPLLIANGRLV